VFTRNCIEVAPDHRLHRVQGVLKSGTDLRGAECGIPVRAVYVDHGDDALILQAKQLDPAASRCSPSRAALHRVPRVVPHLDDAVVYGAHLTVCVRLYVGVEAMPPTRLNEYPR
jgi:hypothetical protein